MKSYRNHSLALFLTVLFPFGGIIYTLLHWREQWAKNTFWLACIYLGAIFIYCPAGTILGSGGDGGRYALWLSEMHNSSASLKSILSGYLIDEHTMDLYQPLLTYFISRFTSNGHVLFTCFATFYGYFYSRNLWYIMERLPEKSFGLLNILLVLFFLICPISQINGVRMWTALHVYVYALVPCLLDNDKSKLWWVLVTPLIHFSYLYVSIMAIAYVLLGYRKNGYGKILLLVATVFFIITLFINTLNLEAVSSILQEYSPETYDTRIEGYVDQDHMDRINEDSALSNWYIVTSGAIMHWVFSVLIIILPLCIIHRFKGNPGIMNYCSFTLILGGYSNITALIPSGGRFQILWLMFVVPLVLLVSLNIPAKDRFRKITIFSTILLILPVVVEFRKLFDYYGISALVGNYITVLFWDDNVPLIAFIKHLL